MPGFSIVQMFCFLINSVSLLLAIAIATSMSAINLPASS